MVPPPAFLDAEKARMALHSGTGLTKSSWKLAVKRLLLTNFHGNTEENLCKTTLDEKIRFYRHCYETKNYEICRLTGGYWYWIHSRIHIMHIPMLPLLE